MTTTPRAYEGVQVQLDGVSVELRPTLRAASTLAADPGFDTLFKRLAEGHLGTMRQIIAATASRDAADVLFKVVAQTPLGQALEALLGPLTALCAGFMPEQPARQSKHSNQQGADTAPLTWSQAFAQLHARAVGWLHLSPAEAWASTPHELAQALEAHLELTRAIHGAAEDEADTTGPDAAQRAQNEAEGLDPDFDRAGLRALKARIEGGL